MSAGGGMEFEEYAHLARTEALACGRRLQQIRRRRTTVWIAAAAAAAAVAVSLPLTLAGHSSHVPPAVAHIPRSSLRPSESSTAADGVIAESTPFRVVATPDGQVASLWSACPASTDVCHQAWRVTTTNGSTSGLLRDDAGDGLLPVAGGALLDSYTGAPGPLLQFDGSVRPLRRVASVAWSKQIVASGHRGGLATIDLADGAWSLLRGDYGDATADAGTVWTETDPEHPRVTWSADGKHWQQHTMPGSGRLTTGPVAAQAGRVVATSARVADDHSPLVDWSVSTDDGRTWRDLPGSALPFEDVDQLVASDSGTLFVNTTGNGLYRSSDATWTRFAKVPIDQPGFIARYGEGISVLAWDHTRSARLDSVDAQGRVDATGFTWH